MNEFPWEDNLLERKTENDLNDLLKTLVAFANSVQPEHKAVILIGEKDDGTIQGVKNPDNIQKKIRSEAEKIYPAIIWRSKIYEKDGKPCLRIEIEYSGNTPHFGGIAWVRKGSETVKAPDEVFQRLIDLRSSKVRELAKWVGKVVTIEFRSDLDSDSDSDLPADLVFANEFWISFVGCMVPVSEPIENIQLSYDHLNTRLKIIIS